ncbi:hypothetical protein GCM10011514_54560 [Emticicia aquatilis]|uniref:Uncharacterized protein n=1 Tax=Emticicia aquatilis TaxID=1537369 RepID=A0A916Z9Z2_9BACT|nr:hypothetical protein [Emticicia aquatilis]GGD83569.1 hypothetical protein GCM10011514_54560 [Emticicia aquatilis]
MAKSKIPKNVLNNPNIPNIASIDNHNTIAVAAFYNYVKEQILNDRADVRRDGTTVIGRQNSFISPKGNGFEQGFDANYSISNSLIGSFYIPINNLVSFLFDASFTGENSIVGFWIWFTKKAKNDVPKIVITKAGFSGGPKILSENYLLLKYQTEITVNPLSPTPSIPMGTPSINDLRRGFTEPIQGYFIGRELIMNHLADFEGNIIPEVKGIELNVRKGAAFSVPPMADIHKVAFNIIYKNTETQMIGVATYKDHTHSGGGTSSSRPCPNYCPG